MALVEYRRDLGAFVEKPNAPNPDVAILNNQLELVRDWLTSKLQNGRYSHGLLIEITLQSAGRVLNPFSVLDEIGKLELTDPHPSLTKKAKKMQKPLSRLWHKHYFQTRHMAQNLLNESERMSRDGSWEKIFEPHIGKVFGDCIDEISHQVVIGNFERRASRQHLTGEFIVFEKQDDGSNYYLTLGVHGEWDAIRKRVEQYKTFDSGKIS